MIESEEFCATEICMLLDYSFTELAFNTCCSLDERIRCLSSSLQVERLTYKCKYWLSVYWVGNAEVEEVSVGARL